MPAPGETGAHAADPLLGQIIGHFRVLAPLGRGGMGVVYRAEDVDLWREVALKLLPPHWVDDGDRRLLFLREARSAASVTHGNIATVYEAGTDRSTTFIAMELIRGPTLREELARGIEPSRAVSIAVGIARGLSRAHEAGILHRDLKPENVMLDQEGEPKLLDFGLARPITRGESPIAWDATTLPTDARPAPEPTDDLIVGTPGYMSPEQARGQPVDARSDVFGLGILLFELFAGRLPFASGTNVEMLVSVIGDDPLSLATFGVAAPITAIVARCLARDPEARFAHAGEVRDALIAVRAPALAERSPTFASMVDEPGARLSDLPAHAGAFFGRAREVDDVIARVDARARLITLVGPGGIGKTRMAREVAARREDRDRRTAVAVSLGASSTVEGALLQIAGALGVHFAEGVDPIVSLALALRARGPLLLLLDEVDAIADLLFLPLWTCLASAPDTTMLVTSRVRSREPRGEIIELAPLEPSVGAELFLARAGAVRQQRADDPETRALAAKISERLDGSPLAIELAAARAELLAPAEILARLDDRLRLLTRATRTGRHGSLSAVLEWSWSLLDDVERQVIAQMSVFRGGATAEAAEAVVGPLGEGAYTLDVLASLRANSLVRLIDDARGATRFVIDESVRVYAEQRLRDDAGTSPLSTSTHRRHGAWLAAGARVARATSSLGIDASGDRWLLRERDNLLACVDAALGEQGVALDDAATAIASLGGALRGRSGLASLRGRMLALSARAADLSKEAAADLLATAALLEVERAPADACELATRACELASGIDDSALWSRAAAALCLTRFRLGQYDVSAALALEALAAARAVSAPHLEEVALAGLARAYVRSEKMREARTAAEDALRSAEARGAQRTLPELHHMLGFVLLQSDDLPAAVRHTQAAIDGGRALGLDWVVAMCSMNIGGVLAELGRIDEARAHLAYAIERFELRGDPVTLALAHANAGLLEHMVGNLILARSHLDRAIALLVRMGESRNRALYMAARAAVFAQMDRVDDAQRDLESAHDLARTVDERVIRVAVSLMGAHLELARARQTLEPDERVRIVAAVREEIRTLRTNDAEGSPLAKRSDVIRLAASSLEWVMRADGHPVDG